MYGAKLLDATLLCNDKTAPNLIHFKRQNVQQDQVFVRTASCSDNHSRYCCFMLGLSG